MSTFPSQKHLLYVKKTLKATLRQSEGKSGLLQFPSPHSHGQLLPQKVFLHKCDNSWYFRAAILRFAYECLCLAREIHCSWQPADLTGGTNTLCHKPKMLCALYSLQPKDGKKAPPNPEQC